MLLRTLLRAGGGAAVALLAACADAPTASTPTPDPSRLVSEELAMTTTYSGDTAISVFTVPPNVATVAYLPGDNRISFPAGAICNPSTSTYGPGEWDRSCSPATTSITFTLKAWRQSNGMPRIDVKPDVRFVPTKTVMLYMQESTAAALSSARIRHCSTPTSSCVDESLFDGSLSTQRDASTGYVWRRIKHFSGYNIAAD